MEIVIKIPDKLYETIISDEYGVHQGRIYDIIRHGTPLPKGHGRLKDIDKIITDGTSKGFCDWYDEMKYADTIIEADEESEEL